MGEHEYTVGVVVELAGVSVRTLHHYDEIGLLEPSERSAAGYRLYSGEDLRRLQRILFYRELDFDLGTIGAILADPARTDADRLREQRRLLTGRIERYQAMVAVIDRELDARRLGITLTPEERLEVFGGTRLEDNAAQAERRWGGSEQWRQRQRRTSGYAAEDWLEIRREQAGIHQRLLDAMRAGAPATDPAVMDLAEEHRLHIDRRYHDCDHDTHRALARSYLANERIGLNFDDVAPGLSRYVHDAIIANAERDAGRAES
ncbi:DNA-binding transcriptional MerR regulator [Thermocatellispora tengchongensis]|uniref:DNA-binding transcriptional MerR regulator n=1 Tax=Thermocatellispora tengchongensis TaxID=1073253 RepID=A0A840PFM7_9ACTN|nr:MerR family transcriptional regulator [Thermocatellispora tengchongensis]MBB5137962.1 DNA-binding transcriptional MerR regulator [Thermocatellispora tengchongensis]